MAYDYLTINYSSIAGFFFLLIFLYANSSLEKRVKRIFYLLVLVEFIEMITYSLELWTTTFATLSPWRLWLSAVGYTSRPIIFCLMLMLAMRNNTSKRFPKIFYLPTVINAVAAFSVFFTDIVYSYTPDNKFVRGPLGYITYVVAILYLITLMIAVVRNQENRPKLEILIIFAISLLMFFAMAAEAIYQIRTLGRASIIMVTVFYFMFFQTRIHNESISKEHDMRMQLEHANKIDGSTGVLNKKAFTEAAKKLLNNPIEQNIFRIGFVFLDLDHLKELNDTLGHAAGDKAIADAAETIRSVFRKTDYVGRFGGDEFYVMLPNIPRQRLYICLNEVQARLQREYSVDGVKVSVSASIGSVHTENMQGIEYNQLVQLADEALYEAKASGRNCHVVKVLR